MPHLAEAVNPFKVKPVSSAHWAVF